MLTTMDDGSWGNPSEEKHPPPPSLRPRGRLPAAAMLRWKVCSGGGPCSTRSAAGGDAGVGSNCVRESYF